MKARKLKAFLLIYFISIAVVLVIRKVNISEVLANSEEEENTHTVSPSSGSKTILLWTDFWKRGSYLWEKVFLRLLSRQCPVNSCHIVYSRQLVDVADAVVFHPIDMPSDYEIPEHHPERQIWVLFSVEAPPWMVREKVNFTMLPNVFNWTMMYHHSSDVVVPYGVVKKVQIPIERESDVWSEKNKTKLVAWMVSDCHTTARRELYVNQLKWYIPVNVYGKCSGMRCGRSLNMVQFKTNKEMENNCFDVIEEHMFYLSFENAICNDYVTEKFYKMLQLNVIPVVFGGADYAAVAPPFSYIDALMYTPQQLAEYLQKVANNQTLYNSYFEWKSSYTVEVGDPFLPFVCDLCAKLHGQPLQHSTSTAKSVNSEMGKWYTNITSWIHETSHCKYWVPPNSLLPLYNYS